MVEAIRGDQHLKWDSTDAAEFGSLGDTPLPFVLLEADGSQVVGRLGGETPALFRYPFGQGSIVTSAAGGEVSEQRSDGLLSLYAWYLKTAGVKPVIQVDGRATQVARSTTQRVLAMGDRPARIVGVDEPLLDLDGSRHAEGVTIAPHSWWLGMLD